MDVIVNYFILLLIFVFDPLAISLVVATSWVFMNKKKEAEEARKKALEDSIEDAKELGETLKEAAEVIDEVNFADLKGEKDKEADDEYVQWRKSVAEEKGKEVPAWIQQYQKDSEAMVDKYRDQIPQEEPKSGEVTMKTGWTVEPAQTVDSFYNADAETELTEILQEQLDEAVAEEKAKEVEVKCHCDDDMRQDCLVNCDYGQNKTVPTTPEPEVKEETPEPVVEERVEEKPVAPITPAPRKPITVEDIKKVAEKRNFSVDVPKNTTNKVERIGSNKYLENEKKVIYRNKR